MPKLKAQSPPSSPAAPAPIHKVLFSVEETAVALSLGRTSVFHLIKDGQLNAVKIGKRRLVAASELEAFALRLQQGA